MGQSQKISRRIARLRQRQKTHRVAQDDELQSLRRRTTDATLPTISRILQGMASFNRIRGRLERAGFKLSAERYVAVCIGLGLLVTLLVTLAGKKALLGILLGIILGAGLPHVVVGIAGNRRIKRFISLFPDAIDLIVRGLRSGLPVSESIQVVSKEIQDPVGEIFAGISEAVHLGMSMEKALQTTARKLGSTEFNFFVTGVILQRETGGNLSEILANLSEVLRSRFMMRMKIKALSSEAKASAMIVGSLPFVVMGALMFVQPDYLTPLFHDVRGNIAGGAALTSLGMGILIMMKMSKFEI